MMGLKVAIVGAHGQGKTTLCHALVAELKRMGANAVLARESARESHYLLRQRIEPAMEIEILGLQLVEEVRANLDADVVICDRSVLDTVAYFRARFPNSSCTVARMYSSAITAFSTVYISSYDLVILIEGAGMHVTPDSLRDSDTLSPSDANFHLTEIMQEWGIEPMCLPRDRALVEILKKIQQMLDDIRKGATG